MPGLKVLVVAGARPNFMKVAPFLKQIESRRANRGGSDMAVEALLVHTGQHYDENMSEVFFRELGIRRPDINLGVGSGSHAVQTARILTAFEAVCEKEKPDWVAVVGDVNSTMACAIVCAKMGIRVAHIEAGLRSYDRTMPEEINRIVTDALADLLVVGRDGGAWRSGCGARYLQGADPRTGHDTLRDHAVGVAGTDAGRGELRTLFQPVLSPATFSRNPKPFGPAQGPAQLRQLYPRRE